MLLVLSADLGDVVLLLCCCAFVLSGGKDVSCSLLRTVEAMTCGGSAWGWRMAGDGNGC